MCAAAIEVREDRWRNRRKMAWASVGAGLGYPLLVLFSDSAQLGAIAGPFYLFVGTVVTAYVGFATVDDKWKRQAQDSSNTGGAQ